MDKKQLEDFFLENEINFKKYFKFEELVFNCWKQHKSSEKKEMINGCFDRYSEFASYKEKFLLERKQFRIEPWLLQPLFKELYNKYFKVELKPDKNGFNSFGRKNKLDFIDKNNKILFEIKRNHKNANWGWGTAIDQFISVKASKVFCNNGDFQDYKFFLFIVDFMYTEPLTEEEKRILDDNEICYYRVYKNKKLSIETNIY